MTVTVSILIPCYNAERWIAEAIESALAQTCLEKEVIVVDDGSTDQSLKIIEKFDGRIHYQRTPHLGGGGARNQLLGLARGKWLQYLDADDYLLPNKISDQLTFLREHPEVDVVFGPVTEEQWSEKTVRRRLLPIPEPHDLWVLLASWGLPQTGAPLWRREALKDVSGWKVEQPCCQEHELYLRLLIHGKRFAYHGSNGAVYRQWSDDTVCKRDIPEVHRRRLEIEERLEDHLRATQQATPDRLQAINQARFETARMAWRYDRKLSLKIMDQVQKGEHRFVPKGGAAPSLYKLAYHLLGFKAAEIVASATRDIRR